MGMPFLCRALSESKSKMQLELSANDTCVLNEDKSKMQSEFSTAGNVEYVKEGIH